MSDAELLWRLLPIEFLQTVYMVAASSFVACLLGLPLGILLYVTGKGNLVPFPALHKTLGFFVNVARSFPFAILMVAIIPFTRFIIGTSIGTTASIVPLSVAAIPFAARLVESVLQEVDRRLVEVALVMGATTQQIIKRVLLPEALPSLVLASVQVIVNLIGYSAMAGMVGGGGLGKVAIQYGYLRFNPTIMLLTVALIVIFVQIVQWWGNALARKISLKRR